MTERRDGLGMRKKGTVIARAQPVAIYMQKVKVEARVKM